MKFNSFVEKRSINFKIVMRVSFLEKSLLDLFWLCAKRISQSAFFSLSNSFNPIVGRMISNKIGRFVSSWIMPFFFWVLSLFSFMFPKEYIEEIRGISNYTKKYGLTFSKIFTLNIGYDILCHCTSSIVVDKENKIWHLRNMDWSGDVLRDLSINVNFIHNNEIKYTGTTFLCTVGLLTGMNYNKKDPFSVSLNYRKVGSGKIGLWNYLKGINPIGFQIRDSLSLSGKDAIDRFTLNMMISPCYLIVARKNKGYLLTRGTNTCSVSYISKYDCQDSLAQTNIDFDVNKVDENWADGDILLLNSIDRRECAKSSYQNFINYTTDEFFQSLQINPVFNSDTVYSCVMCPALSNYSTIVYH